MTNLIPSKTLYVGFVVNIFNTLNYDIHIEGIPNTYGCEYTYVDEIDSITKVGKTHRCRLSGILRKKHPLVYDEYIQSSRATMMQIQKANGWVLVRICGEDKFKRLLVELFDVITGQSLNADLKKNKNVYVPYRLINYS